ncbi:reverse transcriptase domain-containing protein, partial [Tanacetum coccineum]
MANVTSFVDSLLSCKCYLLKKAVKTWRDLDSSLFIPPVVYTQKEPEQNPETSTEVVQNLNLENTAQVPPPEEEDSVFIEIPKPKPKKTINVETQDLNSPRPNSTSDLADSGASINLLPYSIYKKLGLEALTPTRMTLELANRSITHTMGIAEDVVVRVDGFTFLADFVVVNFKPDPRVPIILRRHFLRIAKALIDLYEETLTLRVGKEELVYYADKSEKNKDKNFVHTISVIDFSKADPFSGNTTNILPPSFSPMKTSDNFEKFADELAPLDSLPPGNDDSTLKVNFQVYSNPLFEFDDNFKSSNVNPLFEENDKDAEIKSSSSFT